MNAMPTLAPTQSVCTIGPCRFCGSKNVFAEGRKVRQHPKRTQLLFAVVCRDCQAHGPVLSSKNLACHAWNGTPTHKQSQALLFALTERFKQWFTTSKCVDFWSECDADLELATVALEVFRQPTEG